MRISNYILVCIVYTLSGCSNQEDVSNNEIYHTSEENGITFHDPQTNITLMYERSGSISIMKDMRVLIELEGDFPASDKNFYDSLKLSNRFALLDALLVDVGANGLPDEIFLIAGDTLQRDDPEKSYRVKSFVVDDQASIIGEIKVIDGKIVIEAMPP